MHVDTRSEGILTSFLWMNGGRDVFLTGSFVEWNCLIPMTLMEGSTSVFKAVYPIAPGQQHEYKFRVDGVWRHDEQQPYTNGYFGFVNTIFVPKEAGGVASDCGAEMPDRSNMDLDNVEGRNEIIPRISESKVEVFRRHVSEFLFTNTAYKILPDSGKMIALDVDLPVKEAFHILHEQGLPVAPLWDGDRFVGVLSSLDFILMLKELGRRGSNLTEEVLAHYTISAWKEEKVHIIGHIDGSKSYPRHFVQAGPHDSLKDVALKILQNNVATVPIIHYSNKLDLSSQLLHMASLSEILKCICRYFRFSSSLPILQQPICSIPLGTWVVKIGESGQRQFAVLSSDASLGAALQLLVEAGVSSIPIVNKNGSLLDIYARSDIIALAKNKAYKQIQLEVTSIHQALQLGQDASSPNVFNSQRCQMCLRTDPLQKIMECLAKPGVRRIVIVEAGSRRVEGIISLSDVFKFLLG